ncbi:MAG: glycerol acyltransferase, partial [Proteobacteria bacterium]
MKSFKLLFAHRSYSPLFWTQFFGAFNDNYFKNSLVLLLTFQSAQAFGLDTKSLVALASGIFILPFVLFSSIAGAISDKFPKARVAVSVK